MTDLVTRLRETPIDWQEAHETLHKAADRIEALEAALRKAEKRLLEISLGHAYQPALHAKAGVSEIRAALTKP